MNKTILTILAVLALVGGGVWFYFRSITQSSDINYIGVPGQVMPPSRDYDSTASTSPKASALPKASTVSPSTKVGRPSPYVGPADRN